MTISSHTDNRSADNLVLLVANVMVLGMALGMECLPQRLLFFVCRCHHDLRLPFAPLDHS